MTTRAAQDDAAAANAADAQTISDLIAASSLGTPGAVHLRQRTPEQVVETILAGVAGIRRRGLVALDDHAADTQHSDNPADQADAHKVGYRGPTACLATGITYRQLDYWARTGLVRPSLRTTSPSSTAPLYSLRDLLVLKVVKRMLDTGLPLNTIRTGIEKFRLRTVEDLAGTTLLSDGSTLYECNSSSEVVDLLTTGQGLYGIAISGALRELVTSISDLPHESSATPRHVDTAS